MQDTNERHGSGVAVWFFRTLLLLAAAVVMTVALVPGAQAAESQNSAPRSVIPLGRAVGIKLFAQGVLVVGLSDITTDQGLASPARACGLQEGDVITHINDAQVSSIEEVQTILQDLEGQEMELTVLRDEESQEVTTRAAQCSTDGAYKLGAWIRDSMAGIGTLTFVDPETGLVRAPWATASTTWTPRCDEAPVRGHYPRLRGRGGQRGERPARGTPGGLLLQPGPGHLIRQHGERRVRPPSGPRHVHGHPCACGHSGGGSHRTGPPSWPMWPGTEVEEYTVEILKVYSNTSDTRDLMLRVTDPRLLEKTGGIVQGMSGSPILQDGKLVGAVTHVLIDHADRAMAFWPRTCWTRPPRPKTPDPTPGSGIFRRRGYILDLSTGFMVY